MTKKYIRMKSDGYIFAYSEYLATNPECEVVTEEQAFPERFMPARVSRRSRINRLDLSTPEVPEAKPARNAELDADASRGIA